MHERSIKEAVERIIAGGTGPPQSLIWESIGGGSINNTYRIRRSSQPSGQTGKGYPDQWFCKVNTVADFPEMFEKEIRGLAILEARGGMCVPRVIGHGVAAGYQILVLEWIEPEQSGSNEVSGPASSGMGSSSGAGKSRSGAVRDKAFWANFGKGLARMHQVTDPFFGLEEDNYMGALPQTNTQSESWSDFFVRERLEPQVRMAFNNSLLDRSNVAAFVRVYRHLPAIFPEEPPALLHGDLWCGNFVRGAGGQPVLIDPAVYFGHRSMDLAMTALFGGFDPGFYESYQEHLPLPANYAEQESTCNLYPLLIHLNLFGHGYLPDIQEILKIFS